MRPVGTKKPLPFTAPYLNMDNQVLMGAPVKATAVATPVATAVAMPVAAIAVPVSPAMQYQGAVPTLEVEVEGKIMRSVQVRTLRYSVSASRCQLVTMPRT